MALNKKWTRLLGSPLNESASSVTTASDGSVYITGWTDGNLDGNRNNNNGGGDAFVTKYNSNGLPEWTKLLGFTFGGRGKSITTAIDGSIYITGDSSNWEGNNNIANKTFVAKYNQAGSKEWTKFLEQDNRGSGGLGIRSADDGSLFVLGDNLVKYNADGTIAWTQSGAGNGALTTGSDGSIYITGYTYGSVEGNDNYGLTDSFLTKYNKDGSKAWTRQLGSTGYDQSESIAVAADGSIYIAGSTSGNLDGKINNSTQGKDDAFLTKYNSDGSKAWTQLIGTPDIDRGHSVTVTSDGFVYITGDTWGNLDGNIHAGIYGDCFLAKYSSDGTKIWTQTWGTSLDDIASSITTASDGSIYIAGNTWGDLDGEINNSVRGSSDVFLVKYSNNETDGNELIPGKNSLTIESTAATSNQLILRFSGDIQIAGGGSLNPAFITVTVGGQTRKIASSQITGSRLAITLTGTSLNSASSISFSYNPPSSTSTQGVITDARGNKLGTITSQAVNTYITASDVSKSGIASAFQNLILSGSVATGYGNSKNNIITGNDANNTLDGLTGADTMIGGKGNDRYIVDNAADVVVELAGEGVDEVQSSISYALGANLENLTLTGTTNLSGIGNELDNVITGNSGNNVLDGGAGNDTLVGGKGNDTYIVDSIKDTIVENLNEGTDSVQSSVNWNLGANLENLTLTGKDPLTGIGNSLKNIIIGNDVNNVLDGMGGADILTGGAGADTFRFSTKPNFGTSTAVHITDFTGSEGEVLQINKSAFGLESNATVSLTTISSAAGLTTALGSASTFVYDSSNGNLYWNQNGNKTGFGSGGIFAVLDNHAALSASNISLV